MGGAFSSIADDATALFWNPAGLARLGHQELLFAHANLFNSGIVDNVGAYVVPLSLNQATAFDVYHSGFDDGELNFGENRFDLSYAARVAPAFELGVTAKYVSRQTSLDGSTIREGGGSGIDLGLLGTPARSVRVGLVAQDVFNTRVRYTSGGDGVVAYPRNVRAGLSYTIPRGPTIAGDVDDRWHLGAEYSLLQRIALRAGVERDRTGPEAPTYSVGAGFKVGALRTDYAYVAPPELSATQHFSVSLEFNFNPSQIRIERVQAHDLFASLYKTYAADSIGTVRIRSLSDRPIQAKLGVDVSEMMDTPTERDIVLRPKASEAFPLYAVLSNKAMSQRGDRAVVVRVTTTYQSVRLPRTDRASARCAAYGPGAVSWADGVAPAAAYVTTRDPIVDAFAHEAGRLVELQPNRWFDNPNLADAVAIFDALGATGVAYVPDPNNPYSRISVVPRAVDTVQYPTETLTKRSGDCDDLSVLVAALFENVGISTKLLDVPGHLFLLMGTGIHERNRSVLGVPPALYAIRDDEVWIPLETTAVGKSFCDAWRQGATAYHDAEQRGELKAVDVDSAQARFEPAEFTPQSVAAPRFPEASVVAARVTVDAQSLESWQREFIGSTYDSALRSIEIAPGALNEIARQYYRSGELEDAKGLLDEVLRREPHSARAQNNVAVILAAEGGFTPALRYLTGALTADPADAGIWLNLGLVKHAMGDSLGARKAIAEGLKRSGGLGPACRLLGIPAAADIVTQGMPEAAEEETRALFRAAGQLPPASTLPFGRSNGFFYWRD